MPNMVGPDELKFEPIGVENAGGAIEARCQVMQMIQALVMLLSLHLRSACCSAARVWVKAGGGKSARPV